VSNLYSWVVFLHVVGVFGFLLAHGATAAIAFTLGKERKPERVRTLLDLSSATRGLMYWSLGLLLAAGITAGFMGSWWRHGWIWTAFALLVLTVVVAIVGAARHYRELRRVAAEAAAGGKRGAARQKEMERLVASPRPRIVSVAAIAILILILWLMRFKPF
jgi:MFS family permease